MGRWSETYYDDVFNSKLKGLVSGAIKRAKLEKGDLPTITFKHFVEDLDAGDSFTTSVIEILVQELAERRLRSTPSDRRLIADRTAKSLRLLATPIRIYRERRGARRTVNLTEYLTSPPEDMELDEDDEEFETLLDRGTIPVEGVRINSELVDAYAAPGWTAASTTRRIFSTVSPPTPSSSDDSPPPPMLSPPMLSPPRASVWTLPAPAPSSLTRQSSIRRPGRSRTVDFNEFTSRRRSSTRDLRAGGVAGDPAADDPWARSSGGGSSSGSTFMQAGVATRRFFPFSSQTRRVLHDPDLPWRPESDEPEGEHPIAVAADEPLPYTVSVTEPTPTTTFYSFPTPEHGSEQETSSAGGERATSTSEPRRSLRRGGVRPPESLLLRRVSVSPDRDTQQSQFRTVPGTVEYRQNQIGATPSADGANHNDLVASMAMSVSYPTPGPGSGSPSPPPENEQDQEHENENENQA